jgi:hypothetical protein
MSALDRATLRAFTQAAQDIAKDTREDGKPQARRNAEVFLGATAGASAHHAPILSHRSLAYAAALATAFGR